MARRIIDKIRNAIRTGKYDLTYHSVEEMSEDNLDISDVEHAVLYGKIARHEFDGVRGLKYVIHGQAEDEITQVGIVGRFKETGVFLIITVYEIT